MMLVADGPDDTRDQALYLSGSAGSIPRISHDGRHRAAFAGTWLHSLHTSQGRHSVPELVFRVVAGVGFEPT
jgi:hypothetical protein